MTSTSHPIGSSAHLETLMEALLEDEPTFQFTSIDNLESTVQRFQDQGQYLVFKGVPDEVFYQLDSDDSPLCHHQFLYNHESKSLRIKMPVVAHEAAVGEFNSLIWCKIGEMHLKNQITSRVSALRHLGNVSKEPDGSWGPMVPERYSTLILEVGVSETQHQLQFDARLWLELPETPKCHIHQVITIKIHPREPQIYFQKWEQSRREYGCTRAGHPRRALKTEEIQVSVVNNVPVASGSLHLSFSKLFERSPTASEGDIIFTHAELIHFAMEVWREQPELTQNF